MTGCAADANSWLGLWPKRVRAWRFRQGSRLASSVKGVARLLPASQGAPSSRRVGQAGQVRPRLLSRLAPKSVSLESVFSATALPLQRPGAPRGEPAWLLAAGSTARSEEREDGPAERRASSAAGCHPSHFGGAPGTHFLRVCASGRHRTPFARPTSAPHYIRFPGPRALAFSVPRRLLFNSPSSYVPHVSSKKQYNTTSNYLRQ